MSLTPKFNRQLSKITSTILDTSGWEDEGFVCIDISSCYQNLAALIFIFTFLNTLLKYMVVAALSCGFRVNVFVFIATLFLWISFPYPRTLNCLKISSAHRR